MLAVTAARLENESRNLSPEDVEWLRQFAMRLIIAIDQDENQPVA